MRLQLLETLANGPACVGELARIVGAEHHLVSKQLGELLRCNAVVRRKEGSRALYSLPDALCVKAVALICRGVAVERERLARLVEPQAGR